MTTDEVRGVIELYRREGYAICQSEKFDEHKAVHDLPIVDLAPAILRHIAYMLDEMVRMCDAFDKAGVGDDRHDKLMRWLGFVQGVLWMSGQKTLFALKSENRGSVVETTS